MVDSWVSSDDLSCLEVDTNSAFDTNGKKFPKKSKAKRYRLMDSCMAGIKTGGCTLDALHCDTLVVLFRPLPLEETLRRPRLTDATTRSTGSQYLGD